MHAWLAEAHSVQICALPKFGQPVIIFRLAWPSQNSSSPALRQAISDKFVVPNLVAYAQVLLDLGDEAPRRNVAGSAPKPDHGRSCGGTSSCFQHFARGGFVFQNNHSYAVAQAFHERLGERTVSIDSYYGILFTRTIKNEVGHFFEGRGIRLHKKSAPGEISIIRADIENQERREKERLH